MNREELETITNNNLEIQELNKYINKIQEAYKQLEKENLDLRRRIDVGINALTITYQIVAEQPSRNVEEDNYILGRLESVINILKGTNERE